MSNRKFPFLPEATERMFTLEDLPDVMFKRGWFVGRDLMLRWFNGYGPAMAEGIKTGDVDPVSLPPVLIDEKIVTMAWAMKFQRVREAMDYLRSNWATPAGKERLRTH